MRGWWGEAWKVEAVVAEREVQDDRAEREGEAGVVMMEVLDNGATRGWRTVQQRGRWSST